ncbi:MAG: RNA polymerase sigma factor [Oscillospiraceae bacterium]|nr:RNA polymerase sigma factor [Oscillospiraceae bacterium]
MEDKEIVRLFYQRDEEALSCAAEKYNGYLLQIARSVLGNEEDSRECVNDALLKAWNSIPPHRPENLSAFLGKLARRTAIDRYREETSQKRSCSRTELAISELQECIPDRDSLEEHIRLQTLSEAINRFLAEERPQARQMFLCRYFYNLSIKEIGARMGVSQSQVKSQLYRLRRKLKTYREQEELL